MTIQPSRSSEIIWINIPKPRDMRIDAQAHMHHYFNLYAVRDRLKTADHPPSLDVDAIEVEKILPTESDVNHLLSSSTILVCRVLKKHMKFFSSFGSGLERHIMHVYYQEMSQKSEIVSYFISFCY